MRVKNITFARNGFSHSVMRVVVITTHTSQNDCHSATSDSLSKSQPSSQRIPLQLDCCTANRCRSRFAHARFGSIHSCCFFLLQFSEQFADALTSPLKLFNFGWSRITLSEKVRPLIDQSAQFRVDL
jgi:hypothetical protein